MPKPNLAINVGISNFQRHVPTFVNQICYSPCEFLHAEGCRPNAAARSLTHELAFASMEDERLLVNGKVQFVCWSAGHVDAKSACRIGVYVARSRVEHSDAVSVADLSAENVNYVDFDGIGVVGCTVDTWTSRHVT